MAKITTLDGVTHDVEVGDKVRVTLDTRDSAEFTVTVIRTLSVESAHNIYTNSTIQSLEMIEKKLVPLPTKDGAVIGHPTHSGYVTYQLSKSGKWFRVDTSEGGTVHPSSKWEVRVAMTDSPKFEVLYEGRG